MKTVTYKLEVTKRTESSKHYHMCTGQSQERDNSVSGKGWGMGEIKFRPLFPCQVFIDTKKLFNMYKYMYNVYINSYINLQFSCNLSNTQNQILKFVRKLYMIESFHYFSSNQHPQKL